MQLNKSSLSLLQCSYLINRELIRLLILGAVSVKDGETTERACLPDVDDGPALLPLYCLYAGRWCREVENSEELRHMQPSVLIVTTMLSRGSASDVRLRLEFMIRRSLGSQWLWQKGNINSVWPLLYSGR